MNTAKKRSRFTNVSSAPMPPGTLAYYAALTSLDIAADRLDEAAEYNRHAWQFCTANHLERDAVAATLLDHRATIAYFRGHSSRRRRLATGARDSASRRSVPPSRPHAQLSGKVESLRGQSGRPSPNRSTAQALALEPKVQAYAVLFLDRHCNLASLLHEDGKNDEAIALLQEAVKLIEVPRAASVLSEVERAEYFSQFASAFDLLVAWNLQAGRIDEAFQFAERGRNRTFLDQLNLGGVDLRQKLTGPEGDRLLDRERTLRTKLGTLRGQIQAAASG